MVEPNQDINDVPEKSAGDREGREQRNEMNLVELKSKNIRELMSIARKKRLAKPMRQTPWIVRFPRFSIACLSTPSSQLQVVGIGWCRVMERHRTI